MTHISCLFDYIGDFIFSVDLYIDRLTEALAYFDLERVSMRYSDIVNLSDFCLSLLQKSTNLLLRLALLSIFLGICVQHAHVA